MQAQDKDNIKDKDNMMDKDKDNIKHKDKNKDKYKDKDMEDETFFTSLYLSFLGVLARILPLL